MCGGSAGGRFQQRRMAGLSPRVRGKQPQVFLPRRIAQVYPRVCGGSKLRAAVPPAIAGLSPRVRGKPAVS